MTEREAAARRYRAIFESAVDFAIVATDTGGRVTDWNSGVTRIFGWTPAEMTGGTVDRIFTAEDRTQGRPVVEMRCALETGRASDERWRQRKDGSRFWADGEMTPLRDDGGGHLGFIKILRDRTEQQQAKAAKAVDLAFLHRPRSHAGAVAPVAEDGGGGPAHGRPRA